MCSRGKKFQDNILRQNILQNNNDDVFENTRAFNILASDARPCCHRNKRIPFLLCAVVIGAR